MDEQDKKFIDQGIYIEMSKIESLVFTTAQFGTFSPYRLIRHGILNDLTFKPVKTKILNGSIIFVTHEAKTNDNKYSIYMRNDGSILLPIQFIVDFLLDKLNTK